MASMTRSCARTTLVAMLLLILPFFASTSSSAPGFHPSGPTSSQTNLPWRGARRVGRTREEHQDTRTRVRLLLYPIPFCSFIRSPGTTHTHVHTLTHTHTHSPPTDALVSSSGRYRIELCDGWTGCSDGSEYIGFDNKTCSAGVPPVSKTYGDTVGPLLRSSGVSKNWRTWTVDVVKKMTDRSIVTIKNDFSEAKCTKHYIDDYSEKKDACKGTVWSDRVHLHKFPGQWTVKPAKGTDGKCFNIINHEKPAGCLRYLSASSDCKARHLKLVEKDDGSGLQQWKFVRVGGLTPSPPSLPGSTCVTTGPDNCAGCCKSKFEKFDGSYLDDESCVDVAEYPQCDFLTTPPSPSRSAPKIVSTASGSSTAGKVVFEPEQGATECTVTAIPQGSGPTISATVGHPISFPSTTVNLHNLSPDTVYDIKVTCKGDSGGEQAASNEKELHTTTSDAHPGLINLHPTSTTTAAFHIVRPNPAECDSDTYDVYYSTPGGTARKMTVSSVDVSLGSLSPGTKYEISVDAICKGGSVTKKSAPSFLTTPSRTSPTPPPASPPSPGVPQQPSALKVAPTFHTISVFGPHPEVALFLSGTVPAGSMVQVDVACTDGFTTTVSVPASSPETDVHLPTGLPAGTNCTFTAFTKNGSQQSPSATEIRVVPTATMEAPSLANWSPDFKRGAGSVVVVAPQSVNCTGGIVKYTVTGTERGNSALVIGKRRRSLLQRGFTIAVTTPGTAVVPDDKYVPRAVLPQLLFCISHARLYTFQSLLWDERQYPRYGGRWHVLGRFDDPIRPPVSVPEAVSVHRQLRPK